MLYSTLLLLLLPILVFSGTFNFEDEGGKANDNSLETMKDNTDLINNILEGLDPDDTLVFPNKTFYVMGGICAPKGLENVTISFDGTFKFSDDKDQWPKARVVKGSANPTSLYQSPPPQDANGDVEPAIYFESPQNVVFTSSGMGTLNGGGKAWWGLVNYAIHGENRPRLFFVKNGTNILVENILFTNSAYWTFWCRDVDGLEVRFCNIENKRRPNSDSHDEFELTAFNTDGYDVSGNNVWIHDCSVWTQDDTIAVKDGSTNMVFERIEASGVGVTIGSIGASTVKNITFRDINMRNTYKGIYIKFRAVDEGLIEDVLYENVYMSKPSQWAIWIGPAQQSDTKDICYAALCSICWPGYPLAICNASDSLYRNILLKNVTIVDPEMSPGVILGSSKNPMENVVFEDVIVINPPRNHDDYYRCEGVKNAVATGKTCPVPNCFDDQTDPVVVSYSLPNT